ncbi:MAG: DNA adenine methylase [Victivallaceae bacterium]|nr:DNA adenine methylase [Victivallaceae bacterium]
MKTPITYYGGKTNMLKHILPLLPGDHLTFAEPFFGGGAVLFGKSPSKVEIINDNFDAAINFFEVCKDPDQFRDLTKLIDSTLHSETVHRRSRDVMNAPPAENPPVLRAWAFWVDVNMSFAHKSRGGFAFANSGIAATTARKIDNFTGEICRRLRNVQIFSRDALDVIRRFDAPDTLFYLDPPYANSDCGHYEKGKDVYYRLLELLPTLTGRWLLSSYPTPELDEIWKRPGVNHLEIEKSLAVSGKHVAGRIKTETLTWNYQL